ncbi:MAG: hypothetical protein HYS83_02810 [Candidatus Blackburnbacteria bacterium]|nr:hypothetical protein [Candidatus Blackburnbacteria bacterium]
MDTEREKGDRKPLSREEAHELLAQAWLTFWTGRQTHFDSETRNRAIRGVLENLAKSDREHFLHEEEGQNSRLAKIREETKALARTGKKDIPSAGQKLKKRREKAAKHGTDPKKIH